MYSDSAEYDLSVIGGTAYTSCTGVYACFALRETTILMMTARRRMRAAAPKPIKMYVLRVSVLRSTGCEAESLESEPATAKSLAASLPWLLDGVDTGAGYAENVLVTVKEARRTRSTLTVGVIVTNTVEAAAATPDPVAVTISVTVV